MEEKGGKKTVLIYQVEKEKNQINKTNREIVDEMLEEDLPRTCLDFQFGKLCKADPWKYQYKMDMYQDLILTLLEYDNDKLNDAYRHKHMNALITRILLNNIYSSSSKFYRQYLKFNMSYSRLIDVEDKE